MGKMVRPDVYHVGYTEINEPEVLRYLKDSGNEEFWEDVLKAKAKNISTAEILCSMFAKLCYKSLTVGKNDNITKVRDVEGNLKGAFDAGHGSVFEHANFNFLVANCSRVFTHELVRHRVGTAFSQTSGRYCRLDEIDLVFDPILEPAKDILESHLAATEDAVYLAECHLGLRVPPANNPDCSADHCLLMREYILNIATIESYRWVPNGEMNFDTKKKLTSAIRRIAPNGQSNEIGFSANLRSLRHLVMLRTAPSAEWEIRLVFGQVYELIREKYPLVFYKARVKIVEGLPWIYGMKLQPYEKEYEEPA